MVPKDGARAKELPTFDQEMEARKKKIIRTLSVAAAFNCSSWFMMIPARPAMVALMKANDPGFVSRTLAGMTSGASLFEFLLTPFLGALSDKVGRRPVMLGAASVCTVARLITYMSGDVSLRAVVLANWFDRCFSGSAFPLFLTTARAVATDLYKETGDDSVMTAVQTAVHAIIGAALVVSPALGSIIMAKSGHPKYTALAASAVSAAHLVYMYHNLEETAPDPQPLSSVTADTLMEGAKRKGNPFSFLEYLNLSPIVAGLMGSYFLLSLPTEMHDMRMTLSRTVLKLTDTQTAKMLMALGVGTFFGGIAAKRSIKALGGAGHNLVASASYALAQLCWAFAAGPGLVNLSGAFFLLGGSATMPVTTELTKRIIERRPDMQGGEISGALANMVGITKIVMPQVYANLFAKYGQKGPFMFAAMCIGAGATVFALTPAARAKAETKKKK